jgi:hypothetical protein
MTEEWNLIRKEAARYCMNELEMNTIDKNIWELFKKRYSETWSIDLFEKLGWWYLEEYNEDV